MKKIIIAGGGTGGHIFPAIAIANALKKLDPSTELLFVGAKGKMEMERVPQAGYRIEGLDIAGFNRSSLIKNIGLPFKLIRSFFQVRKIMHQFKPDAVIGVGGYSSFPVLKLAQQKGIPSFLHESNSFAGKSNQLLGKAATKVFVAANGMEKFFPAEKLLVTGNPVRTTIAHSVVSREEGLRFFGLDPDKKTLLSVGGSLGAKSINEAIDVGLDLLADNNYQLIWQTGKPYFEKASARVAGRKGIWMADFISKMEYAYAAADIIISRAGAMAIAEIGVSKKPAILVPYPFAAEDHQTANAVNLVSRTAALMVKDEDAGKALVQTALKLMKDEALQQKIQQQLEIFSVKDADEIIAYEILKQLN